MAGCGGGQGSGAEATVPRERLCVVLPGGPPAFYSINFPRLRA